MSPSLCISPIISELLSVSASSSAGLVVLWVLAVRQHQPVHCEVRDGMEEGRCMLERCSKQMDQAGNVLHAMNHKRASTI